MRSLILVTCFLFISICISASNIFGTGDTLVREYQNADVNQECLKCHGEKFYYYYNDWVERDIRERMNPFFVVDSAQFYKGTHWDFKCVDCHSEDYSGFPHSGELRMEPLYTCIDCHGGDDKFAQYKFEDIEVEYGKSVHSSRHGENYTCWMCHDPHSYKSTARTGERMRDVIAYDNQVCLSCHSDLDQFQALTDMINPDILITHDWLPNQMAHFKSIRCIECHAEYNGDILVSHNIQPKEKAVRLCVDCHSQNSILMASLYRYQFSGHRGELGYYNPEMLENSYVIGANRNYYLNVASLVIFGLTLMVVVIHIVLRILNK